MDLRPVNKQLNYVETKDWLLTNVLWYSYSPETGVRRIKDGEYVKDSFELIQHGWWPNWQEASDIILKQLNKGRSIHRIADILDYIKDRRRYQAKTINGE